MGGSVRAHVVVSGRVQGVWFRQSTSEVARDHDVTGWVRNRSDGSVEAILEGAAADVQQVVDYMKMGPSRADVRTHDVTWEQPHGETGFAVLG